MIRGHYRNGQRLSATDLNECHVTIDQSETERTELVLRTWPLNLVDLCIDITRKSSYALCSIGGERTSLLSPFEKNPIEQKNECTKYGAQVKQTF